MPQTEISALLVLFIILMFLSVAGVFDKTTPSYNQIIQPETDSITIPPTSNVPLDLFILPPSQTQTQTESSTRSLRIPPVYSQEESETEDLPSSPAVNGIPFGGRVTGIENCDPYSPPCFCGGAEELITVGSPRGGTFAKNFNTRIYDFYDWSVGNWVLGLGHFYDDTCYLQVIGPEGECLYCADIGSSPAINIIGTNQ